MIKIPLNQALNSPSPPDSPKVCSTTGELLHLTHELKPIEGGDGRTYTREGGATKFSLNDITERFSELVDESPNSNTELVLERLVHLDIHADPKTMTATKGVLTAREGIESAHQKSAPKLGLPVNTLATAYESIAPMQSKYGAAVIDSVRQFLGSHGDHTAATQQLKKDVGNLVASPKGFSARQARHDAIIDLAAQLTRLGSTSSPTKGASKVLELAKVLGKLVEGGAVAKGTAGIAQEITQHHLENIKGAEKELFAGHLLSSIDQGKAPDSMMTSTFITGFIKAEADGGTYKLNEHIKTTVPKRKQEERRDTMLRTANDLFRAGKKHKEPLLQQAAIEIAVEAGKWRKNRSTARKNSMAVNLYRDDNRKAFDILDRDLQSAILDSSPEISQMKRFRQPIPKPKP